MKQTTVYILLLLLTACQSKDRLDMALEYAGDNRAELEKVLEHYRGDEMKYRAARFLIENMIGHTGHDSTDVRKFQPFYDRHVAISKKYNWERPAEWQQEIDSIWKKSGQSLFFPKSRKDVQTMRADRLIQEIDRSFKAWQENAYTRNAPFEDFCRYILPYRYAEGVCIDNSRDVFYQRHAHLFSDAGKDFRQVIDSLHERSSDLMHNNWAAASMPIYNAATFEYVKRGSCDDKAWYNCLQLSALGMATAIDFVPEWGNRSGGHSWNCVIVDGETHPFEPFWDADRWKYKRIYNNEGFDLLWGRFRLPKVYRHTFEYHLDGPFADPEVDRQDIPPLFRNPFMKDVSEAYFQTEDVELSLRKSIPGNTKYAYLCVFGAKQWVPVQWGKIQRDGNVVFKGMGKGIVYLPMLYQNGNQTPAGPAFLLDKHGKQQVMEVHKETAPITVSTYTSYLFTDEVIETKRTLNGACLLGSPDKDFAHADTLMCLTDSMESWGNDILPDSHTPYRYIRLEVPKDSLNLCEITFFERDGKEPIHPLKYSTNLRPLTPEDNPDRMTDGLSATGWRGKTNGDKGFVCWELPNSSLIKKIHYVPYWKPYFIQEKDIVLQYWDDAWITAGTQRWEKGTLTFNDVPQGTIYRVRIEGTNDRIFTYKNGMIQWY